jgi:hypothetical protein
MNNKNIVEISENGRNINILIKRIVCIPIKTLLKRTWKKLSVTIRMMMST